MTVDKWSCEPVAMTDIIAMGRQRLDQGSRAVRVTEIEGVKVVHEFEVLWHEWECDGYGWVTEDGRAWLTTHGSRYEADAAELLGRMDAALSSAQGIRRALALIAEAQKDAESKQPETADNEAPG
ncbi:MAG: hypothetical protein OXG04_09630 [Acidobacteria bacterium]|nr:hypothetical protein [Acidobacteriota bacterium]